MKTQTLDKYIYWAWIKTIENQVLFANELVRIIVDTAFHSYKVYYVVHYAANM